MSHKTEETNQATAEHSQLVCTNCQEPSSDGVSSHGGHYKDKFLRTVADFENFKHRTDKERLQWSIDAKLNLLKNILPVFDDLERALQAIPTESLAATEQVWHVGLQGMMKNLQQTWQKIGLQEIPATGIFDPELHEALCQVPADGIESGHVAAVLRKGYQLNGIVVRHAQVSVAQ